ncbi:MAG: hypothetical protein MI922_00090 [Bacteroidales bacterium]|nr:hypothetical protein [Bacteroidales bacterium]
MYSKRPNIILGFHGCDQVVRDKVITGKDLLRKSSNDYDWLGNGIYFWENNYDRAFEYAQYIKENPERCKTKIETPSVIGAVIDLGYCLDLLDSGYLKIVKEGYNLLVDIHDKYDLPIPINKAVEEEGDLLIRKLDCAVIETIHKFNRDREAQAYDSVRGVFFEGDELYPNAGFKEKNHIQICLRNPNCIKGLFIPRKQDLNYNIP